MREPSRWGVRLSGSCCCCRFCKFFSADKGASIVLVLDMFEILRKPVSSRSPPVWAELPFGWRCLPTWSGEPVEIPCPGVLELVGGATRPELGASMPSLTNPDGRFPETGVAKGLPVRCPEPVIFRIRCLAPVGWSAQSGVWVKLGVPWAGITDCWGRAQAFCSRN